jgi:thiol-disulfide isomerase/thioredoxin
MTQRSLPSIGTAAVVAVLSALAGFAAVYGMLRAPDNARPGAVAPAETGGVALPKGPGSNPLSRGHMAAFVFKKEPEALAEFTFLDGDGKEVSLESWRGRVVLLNLWATWCAPCRKEMPALDRLQSALGSAKFEVVALAVDRAGLAGARKFLDGLKPAALKLYADPTARAGALLKAVGMPTTLLIDAEGRELGRLVGPAEWDSEDARRLVQAALR